MSTLKFSQQKLEKLLNYAFQYDEEKVWYAKLAQLLNQADIKKTASVENAFSRIRSLNVFAKRQRQFLNAKTQEAIMDALEKQGKIVQKVNAFFSHLLQANPDKWKITNQDCFPFTLQKNLLQLIFIFQQIYSTAVQLGKDKFTHDAKFLEEVACFIHLQITKLRKENNDLIARDKFVKEILNKVANHRFDKLPPSQEIADGLSHHQFNKDIQTLIMKLNPASKIEQSIEAKVQPAKGIDSLSKIGSMQDGISKLKTQLSKKEQQVKDIKKCLNRYIQYNQEGKRKLSALQNEKRALQRDNQRLKNLLNSKDTEEKQSALKKYEQQKRKVKQLSENMENVNASLQSIVDQLNGTNSSKPQEVQDSITQIKALVSDLQKEKDNSLQSNKELSSHKEKLDQEIDELKSTALKASQGTHESQNEHQQSKKQVDLLKRQLEMDIIAKEDNAKEIKRLQDLLVNLEKEHQKLKEKDLQLSKKELQSQRHSQSLQQELAKKGQIILSITAQKKDIQARIQEQLKRSKEQIEAKQRQISIAIQESTKLKAINQDLNNKLAQLIECNTQLKTEVCTLKRRLKDKQEEYQSLEGLFNLKNDQIEAIGFQMQSAKEQLKKSYETKIQQLNGQIARKDMQMEQLRSTNQAIIRDASMKEESIREMRKAREEQSSIRKIADVSKVPLQMKLQVRKKIEEEYEGSILQLRQRYTTLYQQKYSKFSNKSQQELESIALMYIEQLFSHQLLQSRIDLKFRILSHLFAFNNRTVARTRLIFKFDPLNVTNFHKYIDGKANLICIVKTTLGAYVAAYYSGVYEQSTMTEPGLLISITNNDSYELHPFQSRANSRTMVYDPYFLIFGNAEFRIRSGERNIFCNFGIMNSYFNHRNKKVHDFLCAGSERETEMESYEIYEIEYQQQGERQREVDRQ